MSEAPASLRGELARRFRAGDLAGTVQQATELTAQYPDSGFAWNVLGAGLGRLGRTAEAAAALQRAVELMPDQAAVHSNLGAARQGLQQDEAAEACYRAALCLQPSLADAWNNLGVVLKRQGRWDEADACYGRALALAPGWAMAHNNRGVLQHARGALEAARRDLLAAVAAQPDFAEAHEHLAALLVDLGQPLEALAAAERAIALRPDRAPAWSQRALAQLQAGAALEAVRSLQQAVTLDPQDVRLHSALLLAMNYVEHPPQQMRAAARRYGELVEAPARPFDRWARRDAEVPLRVGLVSGDLREHPVGHFLEGMLPHLAHEGVALFAYATQPQEDGLSARIRPHFQAWRRLHGLGAEAAAGRIHADGLDVLLDLSGHTAHQRLDVFAWRPAPRQASWLGYFATTGLAQMDWILSDAACTPAQSDAQFEERLWRLPARLCFTPPAEAPQVAPLPAAAGAPFTFGCFNHLAKMGEPVVALWAQVLQAVPDSRLALKAAALATPQIARQVEARFARHGIDAQRLLLEGPSPRAQYLAAYAGVDLALDPFPFNGGTTSAESLWMGVPVLSLAGDRLVARQGVGLLESAGLADWIAPDPESYVALAARWAGDLPALQGLRAGLRERLRTTALFDGARFAAQWACALRELCRSPCSKRDAARPSS
jgi:predicted O-linked N-acetylglucosamine transferase (SPINDLY family)